MELPSQAHALAVLANGIIPADARDEGAAVVNAGPRLAEKLVAGVNVALYEDGLQTAHSIANSQFSKSLDELAPVEVYGLIELLRSEFPAFYKQLRMDVCALYLSDSAVWQRIGFPGPSTVSGGYPDFDQPQRN
jgi:Gluconate 2-dehydrogenase subunit 3